MVSDASRAFDLASPSLDVSLAVGGYALRYAYPRISQSPTPHLTYCKKRGQHIRITRTLLIKEGAAERTLCSESSVGSG